MQSVGSRLKEAREKRGYTLDEINARTRINSRNLIAIEHDQVADISSPFFYRSFVRQYASEVGVDFQVLAPAVELLAGNMRQPDLPGQGEHQLVRVAPIQVRLKRDFSWVMPAAVFLCVVVLGSSGYAAWMYYKPQLQNSAVSAVFQKKTSAPRGNTLPKAPPTNVAIKAPATENQVVPTETRAVADRIHLELAATERTWLSVSADGKPAYTGILEPPETKVLEGQESAKLRTGNAGGVNITFNGKSIGSIGPRGKTRTVVFTKTGYEVQPADGSSPAPANHIGG